MNRLRFHLPYILLVFVVAVVVWSNVSPGDAPQAMTETAFMCVPCGMEVNPDEALSAESNGRTHYFCGPGCRSRFLKSAEKEMVAGHSGRLVDVVCNMEVNAAWRIQTEYEGKTYHFCTKRCRERFEADPQQFLTARCLVCNDALGDERWYPATYLDKTYHLCSEAHRTEFKLDPASFFLHVMWGIPSWLYYLSIAIVLVVSFGVFDWLSRKTGDRSTDETPSFHGAARSIELRGEGERLFGGGGAGALGLPGGAIALPVVNAMTAIAADVIPAAKSRAATDRFDLLSIGWIKAAFRSRVFRFVLRAIVAVLFVMVVAAGLFGNQNPALNIAPILTWTIWWGFLIILILYAGKSWCYVCPWDAIAEWTEKLAFWRKSNEGLSLNLKWPRYVRNILIATLLFVGLTWIELGFGVTMKPRVTAYLAIGMVLMAVVSAMLFDRKSFCRYGCLVGRVSGLYALFSSVEVRAKSAEICKGCRGKECVTGSETAYGCPTFLYPGKLATNTYCIQCMECIQACPEDNLAVNVRPWGEDLAVEGSPRRDEAYLALLMLAITGFHGLTMTPAWQQIIDAIRSSTGVGRVLGFSVGMALLMLGPILIYAMLVAISQRLAAGHALKPLTYHDYFIRYAYALLPIALFYHIAHNLEHLLMEGPKVIAMISDPFGWGWNVLGTAGWTTPPLVSLDKLWLIQVVLVLVGHVFSLWVAQKTSLRLFGSTKAAFRSQLPMLVGMICFSVFSLWLLKQPMEMRTSAM